MTKTKTQKKCLKNPNICYIFEIPNMMIDTSPWSSCSRQSRHTPKIPTERIPIGIRSVGKYSGYHHHHHHHHHHLPTSERLKAVIILINPHFLLCWWLLLLGGWGGRGWPEPAELNQGSGWRYGHKRSQGGGGSEQDYQVGSWASLFWWPELNFRDEGLCRCNKLGNMDDNKEKLTAKFAKMDPNFFNPVCLWQIQQTTIAYFVYWPAQSLTKINFCYSTRVFYSTIKAANIWPGILLLSFLAFQLFGPPKCLWSSYHGSRLSRFQGPGVSLLKVLHEFICTFISGNPNSQWR